MNPLPGRSDFWWAVWDGPEIRRDPDWAEIVLSRTPAGEVIGSVGGKVGRVVPDGGDGTERLAATLANRSRIVLLSALRESNGIRHIGLNAYRYESAPPMDPQSIGVGDRVIKTIEEMEPKLRNSPEKILRWLTGQLFLPPRPGSGPDAPRRLIVSAGHAEASPNVSGYRLHGRRVIADIRTDDGRLVIARLRRAAPDGAQRHLRLTECHATLTDVSQASVMHAEMRHQLGRLATGQGFLAMWNDYNRLETHFVRRQVRSFGQATYNVVEHIAEDVYRFRVDAHPGPDSLTFAERVRRKLDRNETVELEASGKRPEVLDGPDGDGTGWALLGDTLGKETITGEVVAADPDSGTVDLRVIRLNRRRVVGIGADQAQDIPSTGFLHRAYRGDRRQMQRRRDAFERILRGGTGIPTLLSLLEGKPVGGEIRTVALSAGARACFKDGVPTPLQVKALETALGTPDIALIQGPPGTGKTQVIAALQVQLAEENRSYAGLRGSILLSSFQHAAVDEVAERSMVLGLPAQKVERVQHGPTVLADQWREETVAALSAQIATGSVGERLAVLREVTARSAGYLITPTPPHGTARLLSRMDDLCGSLLPPELADRLRAMAWTLGMARIQATADDERELAIRALRALRTVPESFLDDGPRAAAKARRRCRPYAAAADLELLAQAADWASDDEAPPFLDEMAAARDRLIDLLQPSGDAHAPPAVDPDVAELLAEIAEAMEDQVRNSSGDGAELAILDYLESLLGDPVAVDWTLRAYTASYAATLQQAASPAIRDAKEETRVEDVVFDTVIIDEAARANPLDLMIPLIQAGKRIILVGDHKQLPHMLEPDVEQQIESLDSATRGLLRESLFQRLFDSLAESSEITRTVTLNEQFRMHPTLGEFVSTTFYGDDLLSPRPAEDFAHDLPGYAGKVAIWLNVPAEKGPEQGGRSKRRPAEAKIIAAELARLEKAEPDLTFGVISFYSSQRDEIWKELVRQKLATRTDDGFQPVERFQHDSQGRRADRLKVGSVDAFQGKEFDVVLLSATRSARNPSPPQPGTPVYESWIKRTYGHVTLVNRLCVAMSRQKRMLIVVGDAAMFAPASAPLHVRPLTDFYQLCGGDHGLVLSP
ncbi:DEAD/DEAH box helicase [Actinocorallia longicatena]|uniref:DEAD/DEAH box helicase n=1 Tax=Actinocorallia longicatena TaxID=111803 RepID=UPI0031D489B6